MRDGMRATADINALGFHQRSSREYFAQFAKGVTTALSERDRGFGDDAGRRALLDLFTLLGSEHPMTLMSINSMVLLLRGAFGDPPYWDSPEPTLGRA